MANAEGNPNLDQNKNNPEKTRLFEKKSESKLSEVKDEETVTKESARKSVAKRNKEAEIEGDTMMAKVNPKAKNNKEARVGTKEMSEEFSAKIGEKIGETTGRLARRTMEAKMPGVLGKVAGAVTELGLKKAGEYLGEIGLAQTVADNLPNFIGDQQIADQTVDLLGVKATGETVKFGAKGAVWAGEKLGMKKGMEAFSKEIAIQIDRKVVTKLGKFAGQEMMAKILKKAGFKATVLAFTTATPIPLDDVIGLGMAGLMAKDVYDIAMLTKKAIDIGKAMNENGKKEILSIEPIGDISVKSYNEALELWQQKTGKDVSTMTAQEKMDLIHGMADITIKIVRQEPIGPDGKPIRKPSDVMEERYRFVKGEVLSLTLEKRNKAVLELSDAELNQDIGQEAPDAIKILKIDYTKPELLPAQYRLAILKVKNECGWTKMDHEIIDDKTVIIKRLDGDKESTTIIRTGETWSVDGQKAGNEFSKAVALANLLNKVKGVIKSGEEVGGSERPFYEDRYNIMFDRNNNIWNNLDIMSADKWLPFFDQKEGIDLDKYEIIETLNNWYQKEHGATAYG